MSQVTGHFLQESHHLRFPITARANKLRTHRTIPRDMTNPHLHVVRLGITRPQVLSAPLKRAIWAALIRRAMSEVGNYAKVPVVAPLPVTPQPGRRIPR